MGQLSPNGTGAEQWFLADNAYLKYALVNRVVSAATRPQPDNAIKTES